MGPLTGRDAQVWVQIMHLPPGGLVGRHPAAAHQLFAVVAGSGWATGAQGGRRDLKAGYAALWEPGEEHGAGSESGLTAVSIEGDFEVWATSVTSEIVVSAYNPAWPEWFEVVENSRAHQDHWLLRDLLRADPEAQDRYAALKRRNVELAASDMDVYVAAKAALVAELLRRARAERGLPPVTYWIPE